jgi:hypothetical protein
MTRTLRALLLGGFLLVAPVGSAAQVTVTPGPQPPQPQQIVVTPDTRSADEIRQQLMELMRNYPPSLTQVLRLDPSLLTREGYLAPYPALGAFIAQHPEIALQPAFYLGRPNVEQQPEDTASRVMRGFVDMVGFLSVLGGVISFFMLVAWVTRLVIDHRRWLRATRTQTDVHAKLFDRLTSNEDLLAYIQSPAGQHFLQSAPIALDATPRAIGAPVGRILWSVQAGTVLAVVGLGLWVAQNNIIEELSAPLYVVSILVITLGVGFALSAGIAYLLSQRLGLLGPPKP